MTLRRPSRQVAPQLPIPERSVAQHDEPFQAVCRIASGSGLSLLFDPSEVLERPKLDRSPKDATVHVPRKDVARVSKDAPRTPVCRFSKDLCIEAPTMPTAHPTTPKGCQPTPSTPTSAQRTFGPKTPTNCACRTPRFALLSGLDTPPARATTRKMPMAPSVRREALELEDDIAMALAAGSLPELVAALSRRHTCACSHPVHEAVRRRHVGALRMLLAHGFKADELCGGYGEKLTPLQVCLGAGADGDVFCTMTVEQQVQMVEALLDHGANPNVHIPRPWGLQGTALHVACHQVNVWLVQVLLARGANPNACDSVGQTALHTAATFANGHPNGREITELLVASGASPLATCHRELTARQYSLDHSVQRTLARAERWWRCRMLAWVRSRSATENVVRWLPEDALRLVADML